MSNYVAGGSGFTAAVSVPATALKKSLSRPPMPAAQASGYAGRVSSFYDLKRGTYSETYEPVRETSFGAVWRLESRFVSGRWLHLAFTIKGEQINLPTGGFGMFEQNQLPLLFEPEQEKAFALELLAANPNSEMVKLDGKGIVYRAAKESSFGIVREQVG